MRSLFCIKHQIYRTMECERLTQFSFHSMEPCTAEAILKEYNFKQYEYSKTKNITTLFKVAVWKK